MQAIVVYICRDMFLCRGIDTFLFSLLSSSINYMMIRLLNGLRIIICLKSEFNNSRNGVWFTHTQKKKSSAQRYCISKVQVQPILKIYVIIVYVLAILNHDSDFASHLSYDWGWTNCLLLPICISCLLI